MTVVFRNANIELLKYQYLYKKINRYPYHDLILIVHSFCRYMHLNIIYLIDSNLIYLEHCCSTRMSHKPKWADLSKEVDTIIKQTLFLLTVFAKAIP